MSQSPNDNNEPLSLSWYIYMYIVCCRQNVVNQHVSAESATPTDSCWCPYPQAPNQPAEAGADDPPQLYITAWGDLLLLLFLMAGGFSAV